MNAIILELRLLSTFGDELADSHDTSDRRFKRSLIKNRLGVPLHCPLHVIWYPNVLIHQIWPRALIRVYSHIIRGLSPRYLHLIRGKNCDVCKDAPRYLQGSTARYQIGPHPVWPPPKSRLNMTTHGPKNTTWCSTSPYFRYKNEVIQAGVWGMKIWSA